MKTVIEDNLVPRLMRALKISRENSHVLGTSRIDDQALRWAAIGVMSSAGDVCAVLGITIKDLEMSSNADVIWERIIGDFKAEVPAVAHAVYMTPDEMALLDDALAAYLHGEDKVHHRRPLAQMSDRLAEAKG